MGNRAVIVFDDEHVKNKDLCPAIYLHWRGSRGSVEGFLKAGEELGIRGNDPTYCIARLTQVIGNAIGGTLSLGVGCYGNFGNQGDNGVYWINDWEIIKHDDPCPEDPAEYDESRLVETYKESMRVNSEIFTRKGDAD